VDALAEQRFGGVVVLASAMLCIALGTWIARSGSTRWINGVDFTRIDPRNHPRAAAVVGQSVAGIGIAHLVLGLFLVAATGPVRQDWIVALAAGLPVAGSLYVMYMRLQGLYRR
jgi:hypothetical protein